MAGKSLLISWIGHTDLLSMAADLDDAQRKKVLSALGFDREPRKQDGPIKTLLSNESFDEVHLLSNYDPSLNKMFAAWLGDKPNVHAVKLDNPTDYVQILAAAESVLAKVGKKQNAAYSFFLSPGTPAMAATWILIGKSRYDATFYQTHDGRSWKSEIPFDVVAGFAADLAAAPDVSLQHLASQSPREIAGFEQIIGDSKVLRLAAGRAAKAAQRDVPVLILGESGTGKEMFARAIHDASHRKAKPFIAINCAAIPEALLESELFGYAKDAFTGAKKDKAGAFEHAHEGTLFLDEIGECSPDMQAKLLRVLQPPPGEPACCREFSRVGDVETKRTDVRIISATNRDVMTEIAEATFREDLFYRLAVIKVKLPPLRDRKADLGVLTDGLLAQINREFRSQQPGYTDKNISDPAKRFVRSYDWPGNVRQLRNTLVEAAVMCEGDTIGVNDVKAAVADIPGKSVDVLSRELGDGFVLEDLLEDIRRKYLQRAMDEADGVKKRAAELLGIAHYQTLDGQLKRLGVSTSSKK